MKPEPASITTARAATTDERGSYWQKGLQTMAFIRTLRLPFRRTTPSSPARIEAAPSQAAPIEAPPVDIDQLDPLISYFEKNASVVDIQSIAVESAALERLKSAGVKMIVPLVSQGELIGLLNLGPRLSEQEYSGDDRRLLDNLAAHAAPAVRVAQLVRQHEAEARARETIEQELRIAHLIQQALLPKVLPELASWRVGAHYQPARAVGGDFYDFIELTGGHVGVVIGDASSKGVPAALVMATTRTMLRASSQRMLSPGQVLERVNDVLCNDIPPYMFVTCLYAVLHAESGKLVYANAGHNLPYVHTDDGPVELRATGWPLGLMPGVKYEEKETVLGPDETVLLYSDGIVEAHNVAHDMFGFPRLRELVGRTGDGRSLIDTVLTDLRSFTGPGYEQEDDITLVVLQRIASSPVAVPGPEAGDTSDMVTENGSTRVLAEFKIPSQPGNERLAMQQVEDAVRDLDLDRERIERLKTAVAEATMNAMEHGNQNRPDLLVLIRVLSSPLRVSVQITDQGGGRPIPEPVVPDLEAKLQGLQSPRGWGLFLIKNMVDDVRVSSDGEHHTIELILHLKGAEVGGEPV
jgi:serine phosphatase RsbU (regulator of sigma subunit)/anti-sigma regulatory factor (Ser/Thr protein kinase)